MQAPAFVVTLYDAPATQGVHDTLAVVEHTADRYVPAAQTEHVVQPAALTTVL